MSTTIKVATGFAIATAGVFALIFLKRAKQEDAQKIKEKNSGKKSKGKNAGKKMYNKKASHNFITDGVDATGNPALQANNYNAGVQKVQHHQTGVRHH
ncbi:hypothetical protein [Halpernia frigidisoli]|nr:hypothetical protein [Halpernia frigidisoli]